MKNLLKKVLSLALCLAMILSLPIFAFGTEEEPIPDDNSPVVPETNPVEEALAEAISGYYQASEKYVLDDWQELAAVYWAGEDLEEYILPQTPASGAAAVIVSLIKGDAETAKAAAEGMLTEGALTLWGYTYSDALSVIALEAYNRSTDEKLAYDKEAAANGLMENVQDDGGFDYGTGAAASDAESTAIALIALSLLEEESSDAMAKAMAYLHNQQQENGGFLSEFSGNNANSAAVVIYAITSMGEDPSGEAWKNEAGKTPLDALLSFKAEGTGFGAADNTSANSMATAQGSLALAEILKKESFFASLSLNQHSLISVSVQAIGENGTFVEKELTLPADSGLSAALDKALGVTGSDPANYLFLVNGTAPLDAATYTLKNSDKILAVDSSFESAIYFKAKESDTLGIASATIDFGGSYTFTLVQEPLTEPGQQEPLANIPVDINNDGTADYTTAADGTVTISPLEAKSHSIQALATTYDWSGAPTTHLPATAALIPATLTMRSGDVQTCEVSIRVEGPSETIFFDENFLVGNNGESKLTVYDALTQALTSKNIPFNADGGYLSSVNNIVSGSQGAYKTGTHDGIGMGWDGWLFTFEETAYFDGTSYINGMTAELIEAGDKILIYYGNDDMSTVYPFVESSLEEDGSVTLTVKAYQTDYTTYVTALAPLEGVTVSWDKDLESAVSAATDAEGKVLVPAEKAARGNHTLQLAKLDAYGLNGVVPLPPGWGITVTEDSATYGKLIQSSEEDPEEGGTVVPEKDKVFIQVLGPNRQVFLGATSFDYYSGMTALALLRQTSLNVKLDGSRKYVESINGVGEFDAGPNSGWLYKVNGNEQILESSADYVLSPDDFVVYFFSNDYTEEKGSESWSENKKDKDKDKKEEQKEELLPENIEAFANMTDLTEADWFYEAAKYAVERGYFAGTSKTTFDGGKTMTRAMWTTVLHRVAGTPEAKNAEAFPDVADTSYYAKAAAWAKENDIVKGTGGNFAPDSPVSREQLVTMLYRWHLVNDKELKANASALTSFTDNESVSDWAKDAFAWAVEAKIISGRPGAVLAPQDECTRAETAAILQRFQESLKATDEKEK